MKFFHFPLLASVMSLILLGACSSPEQKADDAYDHVKEDKLAAQANGATSPTTTQGETVIRNTSTDDWTRFKQDLEKKIVANEVRIKQLKAAATTSAKTLKKVASFEKENNDLRTQLTEYKADEKVRLEKFKAQAMLTAHDIETELSELK